MGYEFDGRKYEKASAHQKEWGSRLIAELDLRGDERVLDLGCGDGVLTAQIAELLPNGQVVGIDGSRGMIETASLREKDGLAFLLMDINDINFTEEFDLVFSNAALHWVKDHSRLLANVRRSLRKGGIIRFNFGGEGNCASFLKVIREAIAAERFSQFFSGFAWPWYMPSVDEYTRLVDRAGFLGARVWGENADHFFENEEAMVGWVDQPSLVPFLAQTPAGEKQAFRDLVIARMREETLQPDGSCFETFRRINVLARK